MLVALGLWDASLAQAIAAEVTERHMAHCQEAERHGRSASEQQRRRHWCSTAQAARAKMNAIEKDALIALLLLRGGDVALRDYLVQPRLCGACMNVQESLVACRHNCGRQLCLKCRSEDDTCSNLGICNTPHPTAGRAAIKLLPKESELVSQWQMAEKHFDLHNQHVGRGHRQEDQTRNPSNQASSRRPNYRYSFQI